MTTTMYNELTQSAPKYSFIRFSLSDDQLNMSFLPILEPGVIVDTCTE